VLQHPAVQRGGTAMELDQRGVVLLGEEALAALGGSALRAGGLARAVAELLRASSQLAVLLGASGGHTRTLLASVMVAHVHQRIHRRKRPGEAAPVATPTPAPSFSLHQAIGNRATAGMVARDKKKNEATLEKSIRVGSLGPIEIKESNLDEWTGKDIPDALTLTTKKGKHSDKLQKLADSKQRQGEIKVQLITGENSWMVITIKNGLIKGYSRDGDTETWQVVDFDDVNRHRESIGKHRPSR
jgi:hypothetical protein